MQEELLQFQLKKVWILVSLPNEGIDYDEVFAPVAKIEAIRLFFAYASFMGFIVYQMDVKSAFLYGTIGEEVYVCQPSSFEDPNFLDKVYKVEKALYGLHQAPRAWFDVEKIPDEFYEGTHFLLRIAASTPMKPDKALVKDEEADSVDVHLYRSMIGSLMYLTAPPQHLLGQNILLLCMLVQVLDGFKNQLLDYGCNFMNTKIFIDNESTICIVKNPVFHSKTKHIEIRHHFIRDCYEKKLIQVIKIHTDHNVADLLTKAFDVSSTARLSLYCWMKLCTKVDAARLMEKADFHQIVDFLSTCSINYALTQIHAIVDGMAVVISESSVRSDLLFNNDDGIACLTNDEIFENLALMRYEQLSTKLTFQKGKVTLLFDFMLVQNQAPEGEGSGIPLEPQPTPSTSQPNVSKPQTESLQTETPPTVSYQVQIEAHIEQILPFPSIYQRKQIKTQKHRRAKQVTALPQTSMPLDHEADEAIHKKGVTVWKGLSLLLLA
ncbi:putative ribonuclease H-like domain-containing protein [Tanacetum coccineum]